MQIPRNRIFRGLALTTVYLMGIFGIVASGGGGSGDGDGSVIVNSILLNQPASPTYETDIQIIGLLEVITPPLNSKGDEYSDTVKVSWRNELTGQSGTHNHRFSGKCSVELILVPFPIPIPAPQLVCTITAHESPLGLPIIALAMGSNKITVEARGKTASVEIVRKMSSAPYVETLPAIEIEAYQATLQGVVDPGGAHTDAWFEYSTESELLSPDSTPIQTFTDYLADRIVGERIVDLSGSTTYYYRIVASSTYGTIRGEIDSFMTLEDASAPTTPTNVTATSVSTLIPEISLSWEEATDDYFVVGYKIYRDGVLINDVLGLVFSDMGLDADTNYCYTISAYDESLNESVLSDEACTTTSWVTTELVSGIERPEVSLALDAMDKVHIAYTTREYLEAGGVIDGLFYVSNSSGDWATQSIDDDGIKPFLVLDAGGAAHIAYHNKYTTNQSGNWFSESFIGSTRVSYSIALDSVGYVHIGNRKDVTFALFIATNENGVWTDDFVDAASLQAAMAMDLSDKVHIVYYHSNSNELRYLSNATGAWLTEVIESNSEIRWDLGIAVDSNRKAHISYYEMVNRDLRYATNATGAWVVETADSKDDVGSGSAIAVDNNDKVHISYTNQTSQDLKYVSNISGSWRPQTIDSTTMVTGIGWSDFHDPLGVYANPGNTSIAVDSVGKVHISYHGGKSISNVAVLYATNR